MAGKWYELKIFIVEGKQYFIAVKSQYLQRGE